MLLEISGEITLERMSPQHPFKEKSTVFHPLVEQILYFSPCPHALTRVTSEVSIPPPTQVSLGISQHLPLPMRSYCYLLIPPDFLFSLQVVKWLCVLSRFSHVWLCDFVDHIPSGSFVHRNLQARILEWVVMPSSRGPSHPGIKSTSPESSAL